METIYDFEPVSEIAGNLEISLNLSEYDEYEPPTKNLVLAIGKTGRANRITYKGVTSEQIGQIIDSLQEAKERVEELEDLETDPEEVLDEVLSESEKDILAYIRSEPEPVTEEEIKERFEDEFDQVDTVVSNSLEALKINGEVFEPEDGKIGAV